MVFLQPRRPSEIFGWCDVFLPAGKKLEQRLSPSTLKVYVAAFAAHHDAVDGSSIGKHHLIVRFLKGAWRLKVTPHPHLGSSVVLLGLQGHPFEQPDSVELKHLSLKTSLLIP